MWTQNHLKQSDLEKSLDPSPHTGQWEEGCSRYKFQAQNSLIYVAFNYKGNLRVIPVLALMRLLAVGGGGEGGGRSNRLEYKKGMQSIYYTSHPPSARFIHTRLELIRHSARSHPSRG